jgi:hypothetical protein
LTFLWLCCLGFGLLASSCGFETSELGGGEAASGAVDVAAALDEEAASPVERFPFLGLLDWASPDFRFFPEGIGVSGASILTVLSFGGEIFLA